MAEHIEIQLNGLWLRRIVDQWGGVPEASTSWQVRTESGETPKYGDPRAWVNYTHHRRIQPTEQR